MQKLEYNTPVEVTKYVYDQIKDNYGDYVAYREENGKYYLKSLIPNKNAEKLFNKLNKSQNGKNTTT